MLNDRKITITTGRSRYEKSWRPQTLLLSELWERLRSPARGAETISEYLALPKSKQDDLKDVGGFVAGALAGDRRKAGAVAGRDVLTLDLDNIPNGATEAVCARVEALGCGYCIYSTRKHRPDAPRLRVLLPLDRTATADEYEPCARRMAELIGMDLADPSTFEASRLMYWPSCCADGQFVFYVGDKPMLSVDGLLATYTDWRDVSSWPVSPGAVAPQRLAAKQGDPVAKSGLVGAFCRVYDVPAAMDKFLAGIYDPTDVAGRYTFTGGSTTGGAVLYDEKKQAVEIHRCKIEAFLEVLEQLNGQHALVFYWFQHERYRLVDALAGSGLRVRVYQGAEDEEAWNAGEVDVLLAHPASCGYGLNLQRGGHHMVWFGFPNWALEIYQQACKRLHRQGQQFPVVSHLLVVQGGMDEDVVAALRQKGETQDALMTALRARIQMAKRVRKSD